MSKPKPYPSDGDPHRSPMRRSETGGPGGLHKEPAAEEFVREKRPPSAGFPGGETKPDPGPESSQRWIEGVRIVDTPPRPIKELRFVGKRRRSNFVVLEEVLYQSKNDRAPRSYWAKSVRDREKEHRYIDAQARIVRHLEKFAVPGIWNARHFLEIIADRAEPYKMILCERFPPGATLFQRLCRQWKKGIPEGEAVKIISGVGDTVRVLHHAGVYHWDLSAKNIWITDRRETILFDWDFAFKETEEFLGRELWRCGTPHYLCRERLEAMEKGGESSTCTLRTDAFQAFETYSLISILAHMLIGGEFLRYGNPFSLPYNEHVVLGRRLKEQPDQFGSMSLRTRTMVSQALMAGGSPFATVGEFLAALQPPE